MMNMENIPSEIFDLLESKGFEELSESERAMVLAHMSESEYTEHRTVITDFKEVDSHLVFKERPLPIQNKKSSAIIRWATYRVPIYQVAAGLALVAMVTFGVDNSNTSGIEKSNPNSFSGQSVAYGNYPDSLVFNL